MIDTTPTEPRIEPFIARWSSAGGSERANYQLFITELCELLDLPKPEPAQADARDNAYVFERRVTFAHGDGSSSSGFIDCYRRVCFILEAKQTRLAEAVGKVFDDAMLRARAQAENYARALPADEGRPPFLIVVDVGHVIELYAEFSRTGATYTPHPDPRSHRIRLADLRDEKIRNRLRAVWLDPLSLDPASASAKVTREIADRLAVIAKSLEAQYSPEVVAGFLTRCLFSMFAEDVGLIPKRAFTGLLDSVANAPGQFQPMVATLWGEMDRGGFSVVLRETLPRINGKLFKDTTALPLTREQIGQLQLAAKAEWTQVEPAIFGTLLTRSLDPAERHSLGAEYTPRPYVERLVLPTVIEPLRAEWDNVKAAALLLANTGKLDDARATLHELHHRLCQVRVLDPACGTANFLYVTLEHLKRLEGEVLDLLDQFGESQGRLETEGLTVDPHQFLGLELNPRAAAIAELVLWIGYLQWHYRTRGNVRPPEPVLRDFRNIECRDAVLAEGQPADWPEADYVVGNPPFIGAASMRAALGDDYVEALRAAYPDVPDSADLVMFWWHKAAALVATGKLRQFGLITTNSLRQTFNRRVLETHLGKLHLAFAVPDHPWVDGGDGAAVRIAMTVGAAGNGEGRLLTVTDERAKGGEGLEVTLAERRGPIHADLSIGANVAAAQALRANGGVSSPGFKLHGAGFIVTPEEAARLEADAPIFDYRNGRDLTDRPRGVRLIDLFGHDADEVRRRWPATYQRVLETVKPERDAKAHTADGKGYAKLWWLHGKPRQELRKMLAGLPRYLATVETAKHRVFQFLDKRIAPDNKLICIALDDAYALGVLSSREHVVWALAQGSRLGVGNDPVYVKSRCFETFPFPAASPEQQARIRDLAEQLDAHRKRVLAEHDELTLTGLYNVLQKVGAGGTAALTAKERAIYDKGLVAVLASFHADLDAAVLDAYGWHDQPSDEQLLERLVALNLDRRAEEAAGHIRWLRPAFQSPTQTQAVVAGLGDARATMCDSPEEIGRPPAPPPPTQTWPQSLPEQIAALANALNTTPQSETDLAARFAGKGKWKSRLPELLATLATLGRARQLEDGRWLG
jgi:hypothetical protein